MRLLRPLLTACGLASLFGCCSHEPTDLPPPPNMFEFKSNQLDADKPKDIFVFLDGTANNTASNTNVSRLFEIVKDTKDPQTIGKYIDGVGSANEDPQFFELMLGKDMQDRMTKAYAYIAREFHPGDRIFIFGFSRGAHEARALAGWISYAGIPTFSNAGAANLEEAAEDILEVVKKQVDDDFTSFWKGWSSKVGPPLKCKLEKNDASGRPIRTMQSAEVTLLGVWDTVPGSSLKEYGPCKEERGFIKRYLWWLIPGVDRGERYKSDSYPPIHHIAHAVAIDEKRSKFRPLLICQPLNQNLTTVKQVWFPGAHADVGGGYDDAGKDGLPGLSLNWMMDELATITQRNYAHVPADPLGLAHWSIGDPPGNIGSSYEDRIVPPGAADASFTARSDKKQAPVRVGPKVEMLPYPLKREDVK